jgi:hypothetical protein
LHRLIEAIPVTFILCSSLCHILNYGEFNDRGTRTFTLNNPNEPIKKYQTGYRNRVEYIRAGIFSTLF